MIRVAIADDHDLVRGGIRMIVEAQSDMEVCAEAADGQALLDVARTTRPDVVLMDVRMPGLDGLEATRRLRRDGAGALVIVLTTFDLDDYVFEALKAGASGFLLKTTPPADLAGAIRTVAAGDEVLSPTVTRRLVEHYLRRPGPTARREALADLSARELEVLRLLAGGRSNAEIGKELYISEATVKTHVTRVLGKLGARDRLQAVIAAYESGLIEPGRGS
jgi:DNA-binding NarL/FixJ family response regulator